MHDSGERLRATVVDRRVKSRRALSRSRHGCDEPPLRRACDAARPGRHERTVKRLFDCGTSRDGPWYEGSRRNVGSARAALRRHETSATATVVATRAEAERRALFVSAPVVQQDPTPFITRLRLPAKALLRHRRARASTQSTRTHAKNPAFSRPRLSPKPFPRPAASFPGPLPETRDVCQFARATINFAARLSENARELFVFERADRNATRDNLFARANQLARCRICQPASSFDRSSPFLSAALRF